MFKKLIPTLIILLIFTFNVFAEPVFDVMDGYYTGNSSGFNDTDGVSWAKEGIDYMLLNNIISVPYDGGFKPNEYITREDFVKWLISTFGIYDKDAKCSFSDVDDKNEYYGYIATANNYGIVNGISETDFGFNQPITREDLVTMSMRILDFLQIETTNSSKATFVDYYQISDYAKEFVDKMQSMNILNGDQFNNFNPKNNTTRAEACKIIYLLMSKSA